MSGVGVGPDIEEAKALLESHGYVVVKAASYRRAQERQRLAQSRVSWAERDAENARGWARDCLAEQRRLSDRLTFVWGVAMAHGATSEELVADPLTRVKSTAGDAA